MSRWVNLLDAAYPVGSIFLSMNETSTPAQLIGGTWIQIKDRFLYATEGQTLVTGGENEHKLTVEEMPSHTHHISYPWGSDWGGAYEFTAKSTNMYPDYVKETNPSGGDKPHNNMPPYITCHAWYRTA
jgi:phage structural protein